jgi:DNA mismatch repair ATPase MutS
MIYYILLIFSIFFLIVLIFFFLQKRKKVQNKKKLENNWGKAIDKNRKFYAIEKYVAFNNDLNCYKLTEQTLTDIDIENLFGYLDRTHTTIGQQYLFSKIVSPSLSINELKSRGVYADFFKHKNKVRIETQTILQELDKKETHLVVDFFADNNAPRVSKFNKYLKLLSILATLSVLFCWVYPPIAISMIFLFGVNLMIHLISRHNNINKLKAIKQVYELFKSTDKLMKINLPIKFEKKASADLELKKFRRVYHFLDFGIPVNDISGIVFYLLDLIKSFFLIEVHLLHFSYKEIIKNKDSLIAYYIYIGQIEMALSTASIMADSIKNCKPTFIEDNKDFLCKAALHPLVKNCVPNSFQLKKTDAFITGSNMSGKSTFLRTILINSILSQSLFICFADFFSIALLKVFSSIKISDSLEEDTSYYFKEVNVIHEMIINAKLGTKNLFIIDEIFKGTNTIERVSLAKAILNNLSSSNNIVIASSHDIELIELLGNKFEHFHFTESINNSQLEFDHTIKDGPIKTRNAIKIIEIEGFPKEVVDEAKEIARNFHNQGNTSHNSNKLQ